MALTTLRVQVIIIGARWGEMLGHATIAITLDLYSHVTPTMQRAAADEARRAARRAMTTGGAAFCCQNCCQRCLRGSERTPPKRRKVRVS